MWYSTHELKSMTEEELDQLEDHLFEEANKLETNNWGNYEMLIRLFKEKHRRALHHDQSDLKEYQRELDYTTNMLMDAYIKYGGYLKTMYQKNDHSAERSLKKALRLERKLPIAYYRLGFLSYKKKKYLEAIKNFQKAVEENGKPHGVLKEYWLNDQQVYFAYKYLSSSALHIAKPALQMEEEIRPDAVKKEADGYQSLSLSSLIEKNEAFLKNHAFYKVTRRGDKIERSYCSEEECWDVYEQRDGKTLIVLFTDSDFRIAYHPYTQEYGNLTETYAKRVCHLLLNTGPSNLATRLTMRDYFSNYDTNGEVRNNTLARTISRVRDELEKTGAPALIDTTHIRNETGYYFNEACPVIVMFRSDSSFVMELEEENLF